MTGLLDILVTFAAFVMMVLGLLTFGLWLHIQLGGGITVQIGHEGEEGEQP